MSKVKEGNGGKEKVNVIIKIVSTHHIESVKNLLKSKRMFKKLSSNHTITVKNKSFFFIVHKHMRREDSKVLACFLCGCFENHKPSFMLLPKVLC